MSELTELRLAVLTLTNAFNNSTTGAHGGGNGGKGVAAGVAGGVIEGSINSSATSKMGKDITEAARLMGSKFDNSIKLMDVSFRKFVDSLHTVFIQGSIDLKRLFNPKTWSNATDHKKVGSLQAESAKAFMDGAQKEYDKLAHKDPKAEAEKIKALALEEKLNKSKKRAEDGWKTFNGLINKAALTLTGFVAAGLADTVQGYQLGFELKRLAYQIADSVLPIILSFTRNLKLLNNYLDRQNRDRKPGEIGGLGATIATVIAAPFIIAIGKPLLGLTKFLGTEFSKTMAMVWGKVGGLRGLGQMVGSLGEGTSRGMGIGSRVGGTGVLGGAGLIGSTIALALWTLYESKKIKDFDDNFKKMKMGKEGWYREDTKESLAKKKAEADAVAETPWRYRKKELGNGDRREYTKDEKADLEKKYSAGKKDKAEKEKADRLESMLTTSFGNVTQLWEKMQSETTANPTLDVAEKSLDTLGYLLLNIINIKEILSNQKQTTAEELLTDTPER
jgi:hypothetical protein